MLCLAALVGAGTPYGARIRLGFLASALGDLLLEIPGDPPFLAGMAAFFLAHLAFTAAFVTRSREGRPWAALPFVAWGVAVTAELPGLGSLRWPVAAYTLAILVMMWRAVAALGFGGRARAACLGAILFGSSDTLVAFDRFRAPLPGSGYAVMLLYWAGQALIALSAAP